MDPDETWRLLGEACSKMDWPAVVEFANALLEWLEKGRFAPRMTNLDDGNHEVSRTAVFAACQYSLEWAEQSLADFGNRDETGFALACIHCGTRGPESYVSAIDEEWSNLNYDPQAASGRFLGKCPNCRRQQLANSRL
ncbi:hypothetical protein [Roseiconus lacunae]|uniref:hypothetical protein n=1 Tax=Roseiconus lacunae TaxID=2605694 RepID=UPI00135A4FFB|nr:hypothetical protein [Roseiconus lacunae]